jgi:iron complex outermembrane receptor protein
MKWLHRLGAILLVPPLVAAEPSGSVLAPTVVTARSPVDEEGRQERVKDALESPGNNTVIDRETIEKSASDSVADLLEFQAGVPSRSFTGSSEIGVPVLRGFAEGAQLRTLVLLDGLPLNRDDLAVSPWSQVPLGSLEDIRVLRGGRTVRYGSGATAGVISLTTRQGNSNPGGTIETRFGSDDSYRQRLAFTMPAAGWTLAGQGNFFQTDGFRENSARENTGLNLSLTSPANGSVSGRLILSANESAFQDPGPLTRMRFEDDPTQSSRDGDQVETRSLRMAPTLDWKLSPALTLSTRASGFFREREITFRGSSSETESQNYDFESVLRWEREPLVVEAGARGRFGELDYSRTQKIASREETQLANLARDTLGAFVLANLDVGERWDFTAGASWDRYELEVDARNPDDPAAGEKNFSGTASNGDWSFEFGAEYELTANSQLWFRYDRPLRFPVLDEVAFYQGFPSDPPFNAELQPEKGHSVETGYRYEGDFLRASVTGFSQWLEDEIAFDAFENRNENLEDTWRLGGELALGVEGEHWRLQTNYTYTLARFQSGTDEGRRVPLVPRHTVTGSIEWLPTESVTLAMEGSYLSESPDGNDRGDSAQFLDFAPLEERTLWNLRASWEVTDSWTLFGRLDNVFDEQYASSKFSGGYYPGPGRQVSVGGRYEF